MKEMIAVHFDNWINDKFKDLPAIKKYLTTHERRQKLLDNIASEVIKIELSNVGKRFDAEKFKMVIESIAHLFATKAIEHYEQSIMSHAEKQRRISEAGRMEDIEAEFDEMQKEVTDQKVVSYPT